MQEAVRADPGRAVGRQRVAVQPSAGAQCLSCLAYLGAAGSSGDARMWPICGAGSATEPSPADGSHCRPLAASPSRIACSTGGGGMPGDGRNVYSLSSATSGWATIRGSRSGAARRRREREMDGTGTRPPPARSQAPPACARWRVQPTGRPYSSQRHRCQPGPAEGDVTMRDWAQPGRLPRPHP